ncbi:MAG: HlyD family efflux transporter periplasmic adaptor subunit [Myxococcales bacterium]|jgi:HlyD family secretion protein|nr:MAG: HlyD family efflux transporter periplasmic adaptor subunit [Myxococcales bacterium]
MSQETNRARRRWPWLAAAGLLLLAAGGLRMRASETSALPSVAAPPEPAAVEGVSARGRLEPLDGILRVAGPSSTAVTVIARLLVNEGDRVSAGQLLATLDTEPILEAQVHEVEAELRNAEREYARSQELNVGRIASDSERDRWETRAAVGRAQLARARAELERARITAPAAGLVLDVHARPGERIGPEGILELGRVDKMYAIAEVYETDVGRVRPGQRARVTSPALPTPLSGRVEWIRPKVEKQDEVGTDPAARKDARVVEVKVLLEDSAAAAPFTNLQVEVEIEP